MRICAIHKKPLVPGKQVYQKHGMPDILVCSEKCCQKYNELHEKQTSIVPTWDKVIYRTKSLTIKGCQLTGVTLKKMAEGQPIPQLTVNLPPRTSVDALSAFAGEVVEIDLCRATFEKPKVKADKKKDPKATAEPPKKRGRPKKLVN